MIHAAWSFWRSINVVFLLVDSDTIMDVLIDKNDSGSILYEGSGSGLIDGNNGGSILYERSWSGKRRRMMKVQSVVDWVEDVALNTEFPQPTSESDYVIHLSNTQRQLGDPALENCECITAAKIVEGKGRCGRLSTLKEFTTAVSLELSYLRKGLSEPLVCSEAFKLLEKDFNEVLKNL